LILLDFSQTAIAAISAGSNHFGSALTEDAARHMILNMLQSYKKKFTGKYGELMICCDGPNNWRRDVFPYYKAKRRENKAKAESPIDWEMVYRVMNQTISDLDEFFPYKVIQIVGAEGDDVIAVMAKYFAENEMIQEGIDEVPQNTLIISSDHDYKQLQVYGNVTQWSYLTKEFVRTKDPIGDLHTKLLKGDAGDGVPNAFSDDDVFVTDKRQTPATEKRCTPILEQLQAGVKPERISRNVARNNKLMNLLDQIPEDLVNKILDRYHSAPTNNNMMTYFIKHRMKNLMDNIQNF